MKNITGILYFYIHFATEILCFYFIMKITGDEFLLWISALLYDALAFVPQIIIGKISDHFPRISFGIIGTIMLCLGLLLFELVPTSIFVSLAIVSIGNACVHIAGAETTLRTANGKLTPSAIFVAGGSFGVITGKILSNVAPFWVIILIMISSLPFTIIAERYRKQTTKIKNPCRKFNYADLKNMPILIIIMMVIVIIVRGYIGYGIPTSWNKSIFEAILLYSAMGTGKALGGILSDRIGMRKTAAIATIGSLPFLLFGDNLMIVSLIGVALFSMTMPITLALLVSVLQKNPGVAFGITTVSLFLGTVPIFMFDFPKGPLGYFIIIISTFLCMYLLLTSIKERKTDV